jgi:hypothetical protein
MLATESDHEHVERRWFAKKRHATSQPHRQKLMLRDVPFSRDKVRRIRPLVQSISRLNLQLNEALEFISTETNKVSNQVGYKIFVGSRSLETKRHKLQRRFTPVKFAGWKEAGHFCYNFSLRVRERSKRQS